MSIWTRIAEAIASLPGGEGLVALFERQRRAPELSVAFTIAVIALGAKMAKADGRVTRDEVSAFREVFHIAEADEASAARVFNLARRDVAGFEDYARRIAGMFGERKEMLIDLVEGLFHIAMADGAYHPSEDEFLSRVAEIFGLDEVEFQRLRARLVPDAQPDPWSVLGIPPGSDLDTARAAWRRLVRETHPDRLIARGLPEEAIKLAEKRLVAANHAWETISGSRG